MKICPQPAIWVSVFERLDEFATKNPCKPPKPPSPLVLNGWAYSNDVVKRERWDATVAWAEANGCPEIVGGVAEDEFYCVEKPTDYVVGPRGGPMYRRWDFQERLKPGDESLASAFKTLKEGWIQIVGKDIAKLTTPIKFAGDKKRRLVVLATDKENPPWGTWSSLSHDELKRWEFTKFRAAINAAIAPHEVDHIDFALTMEAVNVKAIRLDKIDPVGKAVNTVIVSSLEMWFRCFVPDLAAMKRDENSCNESYLKDGKIRSPYRVYEIRGHIISFKKKYDEGVPEVLIQAEEATDITETAQKVVNRAHALYISGKGWPQDDTF